MWRLIHPRLLVIALASGLVLAACSGATATPSPSASPTASPAASPASSPTAASDAIAHPSGSDEVVLRFDEGGGFVAPSFEMVRLPFFSLYGDGTVIYRPASAAFPEQKPGEPMRFPVLHVARMSEPQVQALLAAALGPGGLGVARPSYENGQVADAPTSVFTLNADGRQKRVSVYALGIGLGDPAKPDPDGPIRAAMAALADRLRDFDQDVAGGDAVEAGTYTPTRFRASLLEGGAGVNGAPHSWPWPTFGPDSFTSGDPSRGPAFPSRVLSGLDVSLLGIAHPEGGVSGVTLIGPNGTTYDLALRPLLPDEQR
jgi:hypothetical protein